MDEIKEEQRGQSSPAKCSKRRSALESKIVEQENEEKELETGVLKLENKRVALKESPQTRHNLEDKSEKKGVDHARKISSSKTITPRPVKKLKTPTSLRKPGWAK